MNKKNSPSATWKYKAFSVAIASLLLVSLFLGAIIPKANAAEDSPEITLPVTPFGTEMLHIDLATGFDKVQQTQTKWLRGIQVIWSQAEVTQGQYNWTQVQSLVTELRTAMINGMEPIVVIRSAPTWAQRENTSCGPIQQVKFGAFGDFMYTLLTSSPLAGITDSLGNPLKVKYWEIWNEPDISWKAAAKDQFWGGCWGDDSDTYYGGGYFASMLKVVYPRIKDADPNAQVILGGLLLECDWRNPPLGKDCSSSRFLEGVLKNNGAPYFDGVAFHAVDYYNGVESKYSNPNWKTDNNNGPVLQVKAAFIKDLLGSYNVTGKYLLNTENAIVCDTCANDNVFEATKAYYVAETYASALWRGLAGNIWYDWSGTWKRNNGIIKLDGTTPLPAYNAYKFASTKFYAQTVTRKINDYPGVSGFEVTSSDYSIVGCSQIAPCHLWVLWSADGNQHSVYLPATTKAMWDVYGTKLPVNSSSIVLGPTSPDGLYPLLYLAMPAKVARGYHATIRKDPQLRNGDFEQGDFGWDFMSEYVVGLPSSVISTHPISPVNSQPDTVIPSGSMSALLGNPDISYNSCINHSIPLGYADIEQRFTVPTAPGQAVKLLFDYVIYTEDASSTPGPSSPYDRFEVYLNDNALPSFYDMNTNSSSVACGKWWRVPGKDNPRNGESTGWATGEINMDGYRGQIVKMAFRVYNRYDGYFNTYAYVDNVRLVVGP